MLTSGVPAAANSVEAVKDTQEILRQWVEVETDLSREEADWQLEERVIEDRISLLKTEIESLKERIEQAEEQASAAEKKREDLVATRDGLRAASNVLRDGIGGFEAEVRELYTTLPEPLQRETAPLFNRIPDEPEGTKLTLSQRLASLAGILSQTDKFNNSISLVTELKDVGGGQSTEVETLYYGLAAAWFVDRSGEYAGTGRPGGPSGWNWTEANDQGSDILKAVRVYKSAEEAVFVELPVEIQ
ncbi:MAG: DUF3450 family protein [Opitutales bacterium]